MRSVTRLAGLLLTAILALPVRAQVEDFYHPELEWKTIETEHFYVHYHEGAERTARVVAKVAEDIFNPVTSLYDHKPDGKVSFVIKDMDDYSNGAAYFYDNKVEIYAPNLDFELRGTHNWLRNVVTHEFTHIVQIQTAMKFGRRVPSIYFQWLGYEAERRPDVLYGYPNVIVSYPLSGFIVPAWFAEGVAQFNRPELRYDFWDTHRDMILRSYALDGKMLTWEQMGVFGKTSLGNESSYNAGFAFVGYLARTYGENVLQEISRNLAKLPTLTIDAAIAQAVGKEGGEVYNDWRAQVEKDYAARVAPIRGNLRQGVPFVTDDKDEVVNPAVRAKPETMLRLRSLPPGAQPDPCGPLMANTGFANLYPAYSPDGTRVAYCSTKGADYFSLSSLYLYDFTAGKEELLRAGVRTAPSWSPDGKSLYYARTTRDHPHWSLQSDIYRYDLATKEEERITTGRRASEPTLSPDGQRLAFVVSADGTNNLAVMNLDGSGFRVLTPYANGEQVYNPRWSPAGDRILFEHSIRDGQDIAWIRPDGSDLRLLIEGADDSRCATFSPDGKRILFSSDRTGIYNLYAYDVATGAIGQLTNVLGGAFYPTVNASGDIVYSSYTSDGFKVVRMEHPAVMAAGDYHYLPPGPLPDDAPKADPPGQQASLALAPPARTDAPGFDWPALRAYDDSKLPSLQTRPYKSIFSSLSVVPFLRVDNYNTSSSGLDWLKPGVYLFSNDMLDKTGFFAGASLNRKLERDLFLQFFYRGRIPLLYQLGLEPVASLELYNISRKTDTRVSLPDRDPFPIDVTYDLFEFDAAFNGPFLSQFNNLEFRYAHSRYSSALGSFSNIRTGELVPASSDLYLIANTLTLTLNVDAIVPSSTSDINPVGRRITVKASQEFNKFGATDSNGYRKYTIDANGAVVPDYLHINFTRVELNWREYMPFFFRNQTLTAQLRGGAILGVGGPIDEFFDFYAGGLVGMKGYPFYALSGNSFASLGMAYRFPLVGNIDLRIANIYFDKLYASVYGDIGNAWTESKPRLADFKKDAGVEVRLEAFSFYAYPTRIFFNASYGFDRFSRYIQYRNETVTYGREWRFYFGVLFGFDFE